MVENVQQQPLLLLKKNFPEFEEQLSAIYGQDPLFREIAHEYYELTAKVEVKGLKTVKEIDSFTDTINELKEELRAYLNNLLSDNLSDNDTK
jgi:uncharacterized protein YdcH (DUF465 family)